VDASSPRTRLASHTTIIGGKFPDEIGDVELSTEKKALSAEKKAL